MTEKQQQHRAFRRAKERRKRVSSKEIYSTRIERESMSRIGEYMIGRKEKIQDYVVAVFHLFRNLFLETHSHD